MNFTLPDMIICLEAIGYEIRNESITAEIDGLGGYKEEKTYKVYNVYLHGANMCEWGGAGDYRVRFVFDRELEKLLMKLFKTKSVS